MALQELPENAGYRLVIKSRRNYVITIIKLRNARTYVCAFFMLLLSGSLVLLDGLGGDGRGVLGAIRDLRVRCGSRDRPPSFAARHSQRYCATRQQR